MDTIGDIADVEFLGEVTGPNGSEHLLRYLAVEPGYTVGLLAGIEGEDRHGEFLAVVIGVGTTHTDEVMPLDTEFGSIGIHILIEDTFLEIVVTCGNRGMAGIETGSSNDLFCLIEGESFFYEVDEALESHEGSVPLVAMVDILLDTEFLEGEHTTDTEHDLLLETVLIIATIELVGDRTIPLGVEFIIGIEQIEVHTTYSHLPEVSLDDTIGIGHLDNHIGAILFLDLGDGEVSEVLRLVVSDLLPLGRERLGEITIAIEEADGGHIDIAVGSLFDIVTGEDTETTGIDLEDMGETILHGEISDRRFFLVLGSVHVCTELIVGLVELLHELLIFGELDHLIIADGIEQHHGVGAGAMPSIEVDVTEEVLCIAIPAPPEVVRNLLQFAQPGREGSVYVTLFVEGLIGVTYFYVHKIM
jgi:hypothetical protein